MMRKVWRVLLVLDELLELVLRGAFRLVARRRVASALGEATPGNAAGTPTPANTERQQELAQAQGVP